MTKKFIKDNRGQVLYAVIVTIMFMGVLSMITMGLTLNNYNAALNKQQHVSDYYTADAVAELLRIGAEQIDPENSISEIKGARVHYANEIYTITYGTVTIVTKINADNQFERWEVSYHEAYVPAE